MKILLDLVISGRIKLFMEGSRVLYMTINEDRFPAIYLKNPYRSSLFFYFSGRLCFESLAFLHGQHETTKAVQPHTGVSTEQKTHHKLTQYKALLSTPIMTISQAYNYNINLPEEDQERITLPLFLDRSETRHNGSH